MVYAVPESKQKLSQVVPLLVAAIVCDAAVRDPSTGKTSLIGIFNRINVGKFPTQRPMSLFIKVADAEGFYELQVRYLLADTGDMLAEAGGELKSNDRLGSIDMHISFPLLPIPQEGRYEFQVWANSMFLGQTSLDVVRRLEVK